MPIPKPAILQGKQPLQDLEEFYQDRSWVGLDLYHTPQDLNLGSMTQADNLYNVGGELYIRPGKQGQLASGSLMAGPIYMIGSMLDDTGATWLLFVSGATATTGELWKIKASGGATSATQIPYSPSGGSTVYLTSPGTQGVRFGQYFYFIDGTGTLYYTDLTNFYSVTALTEPNVAPIVSGISASGLPGFDPGTATYDAPPLNSLFTGSWTAYPGAAGWTSHSPWTDNFPCFGPGAIAAMPGGNDWNYASGNLKTPVQWACFGGSGAGSPDFEGAQLVTPIVNNVEHGDGTGDDAELFLLTFYYYQESTGAVQVELKGFTEENGGGSSYPQSYNVQPARTATGQTPPPYPQCTLLFDFSTMPTIKSWQVVFTDIGKQPSGALFIANILGYPIWGAFTGSYGNIVNNAYIANSIGYNTDSQGSDVQLQGQTVSSLTKDARLTLPFGSGAVAEVVLTATSVAGVTVPLTGTGTGYPTTGTTVTISGGGGSGATASAHVVGGVIMSVQVNSGGSGYTSQPSVSFAGTGGSGATGTVVLTGTSIASVTIPSGSGGSGYLRNTVVQFQDPGGGTGATASVTLDGDNDYPPGNAIQSVTVGSGNGGSGYTGATQAVFGQSFASLEYVSVPLKGFIESGTLQFAAPSDAIELRILPAGNDSNGSPWTYQSVLLTIDPSGNFASGDMTSLLADAVACVASAQIHFLDNPIVSANAFSFSIGGLTISGNLSVGFGQYTYVYTEVDSKTVDPTGDPQLVQIIQSDPSPYSNTLTPTGEFATAQLLMPSTPSNTESDMWFLYRAGGTFSDGLFRLVDAGHWSETWSFGQPRSHDTPPGMQLQPMNPFTTWGQNDQNNDPAPTGSVYLVDNTPDAKLVNNPTLIVGRQPAPAGASAIESFQNRLWLAAGGTVISSWLLGASSDAGLYFNPTLDPTDPNAPIKGSGSIAVGQDDNDPVVGLKALGTVLTVWKGLSSYFIDGYDPTNFGCNEYQAIEGQGLVAPRAIVVADNVLYMMEQDGIYTFDGSQMTRISDAIGPLLNPVLNEDGGQISAAAYANCASVYHGGRLYVFAPVVGGSENSMAFVWDSRAQAWVGRWTGMNITSGVAIGTNTDDPDIWLGGYDGQLYRFTGNGDISAAGGSTSAVSFALTTRAYGRPPQGLSIWMQGRYNLPLGIEDGGWEAFFRKARVTRLWVEADTGTSGALSLTAGTQYVDATTAVTYPVTVNGHQRVSVRTKPDRGGLGAMVTLSGSTASGLKIVAAGVTISRGAKVR